MKVPMSKLCWRVVRRALWRQVNFQFWRFKVIGLVGMLALIYSPLPTIFNDEVQVEFHAHRTAFMDRACDNRVRELCALNSTVNCAGTLLSADMIDNQLCGHLEGKTRPRGFSQKRARGYTYRRSDADSGHEFCTNRRESATRRHTLGTCEEGPATAWRILGFRKATLHLRCRGLGAVFHGSWIAKSSQVWRCGS